MTRLVASGTVAGGPAGALNWDLSTGNRRRPHYYTRESLMQHWLNLVPMAGLPTLTKEARDDHFSDPGLTRAERLLLPSASAVPRSTGTSEAIASRTRPARQNQAQSESGTNRGRPGGWMVKTAEGAFWSELELDRGALGRYRLDELPDDLPVLRVVPVDLVSLEVVEVGHHGELEVPLNQAEVGSDVVGAQHRQQRGQPPELGGKA